MSAPDWIKHTEFDGNDCYCRTGELSPEERTFMEGRDRANTVAQGNASRSYEYDEWALCELDNKYYVFNTAGCSCPSPEETWILKFCGTKEQILEVFNVLNDEGWNDLVYNTQEAGWVLNAVVSKPQKSDW